MKRVKIDTDKITSLEDVKAIFKYMELYFLPEVNPNYKEIEHLLMENYEIEVTEWLGKKLDGVKIVKRDSGDISVGCWVVMDGKLYQVDAYFLFTHKDKEGIIKVQKPNWI